MRTPTPSANSIRSFMVSSFRGSLCGPDDYLEQLDSATIRFHDPDVHPVEFDSGPLTVGFKHLKDTVRNTASVHRERPEFSARDERRNPSGFERSLGQGRFKIRGKRCDCDERLFSLVAHF